MTVPEAPLERTEQGLAPAGEGWFVLNAKEARWVHEGVGPKLTFFEGGARVFDQIGINVSVMGPGEPMSMYHWEDDQEDFLIVAGEALAIVEGQERPLKAWDLVHCPRGTRHVIVGAGPGCVVVSIGSRSSGNDWGAYTVDPAAAKHGAAVEEETTEAGVAYARFRERRPIEYEEGWLP